MADIKVKSHLGPITKRNRCLLSESKYDVNAVSKYYTRIMKQLESPSYSGKNNQLIQNDLRSLLESLQDSNTANLYIEYPISLLEIFNKKEDEYTAKYILKEFTENILPYISELSCIEETVNRYELTDDERKSIFESAKNYIAADRILENHRLISKRFDIEGLVHKKVEKDLRATTESYCSMIDTYADLTPYQKLNLCLEEISYIYDKNNISYDRREFINCLAEYFLLSNPILTSKDRKGYKKVFTEGYYVERDDKLYVNYLLDEDYEFSDTIVGNIKSFLAAEEKTLDLFTKTIYACLQCADKIDLEYNFGNLLHFINNVFNSDLFDPDELYSTMSVWVDRLHDLVDKFSYNTDENISREFFNRLYFACSRLVDEAYIDNAKATFLKIRIMLMDYMDLTYTETNIVNMKFVMSDDLDPVSLSEAKIFKNKGLIRAVINLDKYLGDKCKKAIANAKDKINDAKAKADAILFPEKEKKQSKVGQFLKNVANGAIDAVRALIKEADNESIYYPYIGEDYKFDVTIYRMPIFDNIDYTIHDELSDLCEEFNVQLEKQGIDTARCYYLITSENMAEIHLKDATPLILTDEQKQLIRESRDPDMEYYMDMLCEAEAFYNIISENNIDIEDKLFSLFSENEDLEINNEYYDAVLEALSILGVDKSVVKVFGEKYKHHAYMGLEESADSTDIMKSIDKITESYEPEKIDDDMIQLEAYLALTTLLEAPQPVYATVKSQMKDKENQDKMKQVRDAKDKEQKDKQKEMIEKEKVKKNPFAGINLSTIKLMLQGMKAKFKSASQKEKEISKNVDMNVRNFVKAMKNALISDRREAIIKGSVIPSFSKCVKLGVALAGLSWLNPAAGVIAAVGGFAMSKRLTKKERMLLLDEIETELDVLEKEIAMAESDGNMKKYRALLKYRKDLQRQYQRIKYNIRVGKDILPGSTVGIKNYEQ